ncbi:hypothetical protein [Pontibacter sp. G13]|uniref:hypothetical protein n=1 Tax=Pontibacter sp. G13 TaxID=3074898 RepID=UPI00288A1CDA|nr:hypothetical protein [Pontibacter sp. G13]WNJ16970.1 hypothetical protein RJD25_19120 [Pontibacter sp. G13]
MIHATDLSKMINKNGGNLLDSISIDDIRPYWRLRLQLLSGDITENEKFQEEFKSFYGISGIGVNKEFMDNFYQVLENTKQAERIDFRSMHTAVFGPRPKRKLSSPQFGFLSKIANLVDPSYPIYDNYVAELFGFDRPTQTRLESRERLSIYLEFYNHQRSIYRECVEEGMIKNPITVFKILLKKYKDDEFPEATLPDMKKMDYLVAVVAKFKEKQSLV